MSNELNPYESPAYSGEKPKPVEDSLRTAARTSLRMTLIILLIPAAYNYYCFDGATIGNEGLPTLSVVARSVNVGGMLVASLLVWFFSLPILELATQLVFRLFSRQSKLPQWYVVLYEVLRTIVYFAVPAALLWWVWTFGFYKLEIGFYAISYPIGVLAHLLAAGLYVPLIYRWYRLEKTAQSENQVDQRWPNTD